MRVLDVRQETQEKDIQTGRRVLRSEIDRPATNLCIVRGKGPEISRLADRCAGRSDAFPWREVVWVLDDAILTNKQRADWFGNGHAAVILGFDDEPVATLDLAAEVLDIELAFLHAQQGGGNR